MSTATKNRLRLSDILTNLPGAEKKGPAQWMAPCPAHADDKPSLSVSLVKSADDLNVLLLNCFAGCNFHDICKELEISPGDTFDIEVDSDFVIPGRESSPRSPDNLTPEMLSNLTVRMARAEAEYDHTALDLLSARTGVSDQVLKSWGIGTEDGLILIPALDVNGTTKGIRIRDPHPGAEVKERGLTNPRVDGVGWLSYSFNPAVDRVHDELVITEGPVDGLTMSGFGFDTFSVFGAQNATNPVVQRDLLTACEGRTAIVCGDADSAGREFSQALSGHLVANGVAVRVVEPPREAWDLNDWYASAPGAFLSEFRSAVSDAQEVLDRIHSSLSRFVYLPDKAWYDVLSMWSVLCHLIRKPDARGVVDIAPRVGFLSAVPGSGKTETTSLLAKLIGADMNVDPTPAVMVRMISATDYADDDPERPRTPVPLAIDEIDNVYNGKSSDRGQFTTVMNSGYKVNGKVRRADPENPKKIHVYDVFSPIVWNGLAKANIPPALVSRSFMIEMQKATRAESATLERFFEFRHGKMFKRLHDDTVLLADSWSTEQVQEALYLATDQLSEVANNRELELWCGLLVVAILMDGTSEGSNWQDRFWSSYRALQHVGQTRSETLSLQFLRACRVVHAKGATGNGFTTKGIWTTALVDQVCEVDDTFKYANHGFPVTPIQVAHYLRDFQVDVKQVKINGQNKQGYRWEVLEPVFDRYLDDVEEEPEESGVTPDPARYASLFES